MAKMFRVDHAWINLGFVVRLERWPAMEGTTWSDDEKRPRLYVCMIGNSGVELTEAMAVTAGYSDMAECESALISALDAYNG